MFTVTIRKEATAAATYKRGTVLALSAGTAGDGKLVILGSTATTNETLTANCILAEDVEVGTTADVTVLPTAPATLPATSWPSQAATL